MPEKFIIYYIKGNDYIVIHSDDDKIIYQMDTLPSKSEYNRFTILRSSGHLATLEGLRNFYNDFCKWNNQLLENKYWTFSYSSSFSHYGATLALFKNLKIDVDTDNIDNTECEWIEKCYNAGIIYSKEGTYENAYGYDFSFNYPTILASEDFKFPIKKGVEVFIKKIPDRLSNIQSGYYRVKITCDNPEFRKVFAFSKHNVYTNTSLRFAIEQKERFGVKIELIIDDKPNLYSYKSTAMITGHKIFNRWFLKLTQIKKAYPDNKLVKHLASSLWGSLSRKIYYHRTKEDIIKEGLLDNNEYDIADEIVDRYTGEHIHYKLIKFSHRYATNYRLKPFITAFARNKIGKVVLNDVDGCVRVIVDGVIFKNELKTRPDDLKEDLKNTGNLVIGKVNTKPEHIDELFSDDDNN